MAEKTKRVTWRQVFDADKKRTVDNTHYINVFVWSTTTYEYFSYEGKVYKVSKPEEFGKIASVVGINEDVLW